MPDLLQTWVRELPLMMQGTLMTGVRGVDAPAPKVKPVGRWLRSLLMNNGNPENDFMEAPARLPAVEDFEGELEMLPVHYMLHLLHCLEIVGYKHPDPETADAALDYYLRLCSWMHLSPETELELDERLSGKPGTTGSAKRWVRLTTRLRAPQPTPEPPPPPAPVHTVYGRGGS